MKRSALAWAAWLCLMAGALPAAAQTAAAATCRPASTELLDQGEALKDQDHLPQAMPLFEDALRQCRAANDQIGISSALLRLGGTLDLLNSYGLKDEYRARAVSDYRVQALAQLGAKIETEVRAWHDDHFWQTLFSGQSAEDDVAGAENIIREARESGGEGLLHQ